MDRVGKGTWTGSGNVNIPRAGSGKRLCGNDGTRMERKPYHTGAPLQGDPGPILIISSDDSLMKDLNLLTWKCEGFKAIYFRCSYEVLWLVFTLFT